MWLTLETVTFHRWRSFRWRTNGCENIACRVSCSPNDLILLQWMSCFPITCFPLFFKNNLSLHNLWFDNPGVCVCFSFKSDFVVVSYLLAATNKDLWSSDLTWFSALESSQWLCYVSKAIAIACRIVSSMLRNTNVVIRGNILSPFSCQKSNRFRLLPENFQPPLRFRQLENPKSLTL